MKRLFSVGLGLSLMVPLLQSAPSPPVRQAAVLNQRSGAARLDSISYPADWNRFDLPAPADLKQGPALTLWATWYWTPSYNSSTDRDAVPLLDEQERPLGPRLSPERFCHAAVQGAVRVDNQTYAFADADVIPGRKKLAGCEKFRPDMPQAPFVRFRPSATPFGEADQKYLLIPYRSVAVDTDAILVGTVLYIAKARGCPLILPDGTHVRHDGYFLAADQGYGIEDHHIDVFNGISAENPFPWVTSSSSGVFTAVCVRDKAIIARLQSMHRIPGKPIPAQPMDSQNR